MTGSPTLLVRVRRGLRVNTLRPSPLTAVDPMEEPPASPLLGSIGAVDISHIMRGDVHVALFGINEDTSGCHSPAPAAGRHGRPDRCLDRAPGGAEGGGFGTPRGFPQHSFHAC